MKIKTKFCTNDGARKLVGTLQRRRKEEKNETLGERKEIIFPFHWMHPKAGRKLLVLDHQTGTDCSPPGDHLVGVCVCGEAKFLPLLYLWERLKNLLLHYGVGRGI